jgi:hypothetical protein
LNEPGGLLQAQPIGNEFDDFAALARIQSAWAAFWLRIACGGGG